MEAAYQLLDIYVHIMELNHGRKGWKLTPVGRVYRLFVIIADTCMSNRAGSYTEFNKNLSYDIMSIARLQCLAPVLTIVQALTLQTNSFKML